MSLAIPYAYSRFRMSMSFAWSSSKILEHEQMFNLIQKSQNHVIIIQPLCQLYFYKNLLITFFLKLRTCTKLPMFFSCNKIIKVSMSKKFLDQKPCCKIYNNKLPLTAKREHAS